MPDMALPFDPWRRVYAPWMAEFFGSLLFTLFSDLLGTLPDGPNELALLEAALLLSLMLAFGSLSGGHFNPALTAGSLLCLGTPLLLGLSLLLAQCMGAFAGALLFRSTVSGTAFLDALSRLGILRVQPFVGEEQEEDWNGTGGGRPAQLLVTNSGLDWSGSSPFGSRLQMFLAELFCSSLLVLVPLLSSALSHSLICTSIGTASARLLASAIGLRSPLGQSANLARALANFLLATVFTRSQQPVIWRLFHLHFFGAICSAIAGAALFWLFKWAEQNSTEMEQQQEGPPQTAHQRRQQQHGGGTTAAI